MNFPVGVSIDSESGFLTIVEHKYTSLYELIHYGNPIPAYIKRAILINLARLLTTFHFLALFHGHLSSHNIFVDFKPEAENDDDVIVVRVGQAELKDLSIYANLFYQYRDKSVWSAPECLQ